MIEPIPFPSPDGAERKALADAAKELLNNRAFTTAILALRKEWHAESMKVTRKREAFFWNMRMQALEAIPQRLQILINDQIMHEARKR
jgi:hypothetical protein